MALAQRITADALPAGPNSASLAAGSDGARHLTIEVHVNGRGPFHFVVDTGAERSVISAEAAAALTLARGEDVLIQGIAKAMAAPTLRAETVAFGPFIRHDILMPVLPQSTLAADGYLGLDVIDGTRVTFDFKNQKLHIEQPARHLNSEHPNENHMAQPSGLLGSDDVLVQAQGRAGRLQVVDALVDGVAATAFIDTGAEVSVGNGALLDALQARRPVASNLGSTMLTGVTGGQMEAHLIPVPRVRLENLQFTDCVLAIADVPDFGTWDLRTQPALLIGMDYLRQFASLSIDYRAKELHFELSAAPPHPRPGVQVWSYG